MLKKFLGNCFIMTVLICFLSACGKKDYSGQYGGISDEGIFLSLYLDKEGNASTNMLGIPLSGTYRIRKDRIDVTLSNYGYSDTLSGKIDGDEIIFADVTLKKGVSSADIDGLMKSMDSEEVGKVGEDEKIDDSDQTIKENVTDDEPDLIELDPFKNLEIQYDGISPYLTPAFNTSKQDRIVQENIGFEVEDKEYVKSGEEIEVTANYDDEAIEKTGFFISEEKEHYMVPDLPEYIEDFEKVEINRVEDEMLDYVTAKTYGAIGSQDKFIPVSNPSPWITTANQITSIDEIKPVKKFYIVCKPQYEDFEAVHNMLAGLYEVNLSFQYLDKHNDLVNVARTSYALVFAKNIIDKRNGEITWMDENSSEGEGWEDVEGQADNYDQLIGKNIYSLKDKYNVKEVE